MTLRKFTLALDFDNLEAEAVFRLWQTEFCHECNRRPFIDTTPNRFWLKVMTDYRRLRDLIAEGYSSFSATGFATFGAKDVCIVDIKDLNSQPQRFVEVVKAGPGRIEVGLEFDQVMFNWFSQWMTAMGISGIVQFMDLAVANGLVIYRLKKTYHHNITACDPDDGRTRQVRLVSPDDFCLQMQKVRVERTFEGDMVPMLCPLGTELED